jgi:hypothetical protein
MVGKYMAQLQVDCYAGHRGEQTPRTLELDDRRIVVREVLDQWLAPDHRYFKLLGDDGHTYVVRQDVESQTWELTVFQRGPAAGPA